MNKRDVKGSAIELHNALFEYCKEHDLMLVCGVVWCHEDTDDGQAEHWEGAQSLHGRYADFTPSMQAFVLVNRMPSEQAQMAVDMLRMFDAIGESIKEGNE